MLVLIVAMASVQVGAVLVKGLFPLVGVGGATALRLALASIMLLAVWRPWRLRPTAQEARSLVIYGARDGMDEPVFLSGAQSNSARYSRIARVHGAAGRGGGRVAPPVDFLWVLLAAIGIAGSAAARTHLGSARAGGRRVCARRRTSAGPSTSCSAARRDAVHGGGTAALGTLIGALVIAPIGVPHAGAALLSPAVLPAACALALLSSALPYSLEMFALTRLPTRTFGVLMSARRRRSARYPGSYFWASD